MKPELAAAIASDTRDLAERLSRPVEDPTESAERLVRWLVQRGWRKSLALAETVPPRRSAPSPRKDEYLAEIRQTLTERKATRP